MNFLLVILFICGVPLLIVVIDKIFIFLWNTRERKYRDFVLNNSVAIRQLSSINNKYHFYTSKNYDNSYTYDNIKFYNLISCEDFLIYKLQFIKREVSNEIKKINENVNVYIDYLREVDFISTFGCFNASTKKLNLSYLLSIEKKVFDKLKLKPQLDFFIKITLYLSNMDGIVTYKKKSEIFDSDEILCLIKKLYYRTGYYYNNKSIWDAICRVERGWVTNRVRFAIYRRDGWRCRKCGKGQAHAHLEIDHIKPIAKGGKSTYDNLQTLCHVCNKEKGAKY